MKIDNVYIICIDKDKSIIYNVYKCKNNDKNLVHEMRGEADGMQIVCLYKYSCLEHER